VAWSALLALKVLPITWGGCGAGAWQGKYAEALTDVSRVDAPVTLNNVGYIAMQRGDLGHAEAYFAQAMQLSPAFYDKADRNLNFLHDMKKLGQHVTAAKG